MALNAVVVVSVVLGQGLASATHADAAGPDRPTTATAAHKDPVAPPAARSATVSTKAEDAPARGTATSAHLDCPTPGVGCGLPQPGAPATPGATIDPHAAAATAPDATLSVMAAAGRRAAATATPATATGTGGSLPPSFGPAAATLAADGPAIEFARTAARLTGRRVAVKELEDARWESYADPDGTLSTDFHTTDVRVPTADGWRPVDTSLSPTSAGPGLMPAASPLSLTVGGGGNRLAQVVLDGHAAILSWTSALPAPTASGSEATFAGVAAGQDVVVSDTSSSVSADVTLTRAPVGPAGPWTFAFQAPGLALRQAADGTVHVVATNGGTVVATVPAPLVYGAAGPSPDGSTPTAVGTLAVTPALGGGQDLTVALPTGFLQTPGLAYPVTVDPTISIANAVSDTYVDKNAPTTAHDGGYYLYSGYNGSDTYRTLVGFDTDIVTASNGTQYVSPSQGGGVISASLSMWNYQSAVCNSSPDTMNVFELTNSWSAPAVTWNQNVTANGKMISSTSTGYGPAACTGNHLVLDVSTAGRDWYNGVANNGLSLSASNESATSDFRSFTSEEYGANQNNPGFTPTLTLTYYYYPTAPQSVTLAANVTPSTVNASWAAPADNGGYAVSSYNYNAYDQVTGTYIASGNTTATGVAIPATNGHGIVLNVQACTNGNKLCGPAAQSNQAVPTAPSTAVLNLAATAGSQKVAATWTAPANTGGATISSYFVLLYPAGSQYCQTNYVAAQSVTGTSVTFNAATPGNNTNTLPGNGSAYQVEVFPVTGTPFSATTNGCSESAGGGTGALTSSVTAAALPGAPVAALATVSGQSVTVSWQPPTNAAPGSAGYPGAPVDAYAVLVYPVGSDFGSTCVGFVAVTAPTTTATLNGASASCGSSHVSPGGTYVARVFAHDSSSDTTTFNNAAEGAGYGPPAPLTLPVSLQGIADSQLGLENWWTFVHKSLGGQGTASVNVGNGNLVVQSSDSTPVQAHGHLAFTLDRTYNSRQLAATLPSSGTIGNGWQLNIGSAGDATTLGMGTAGLSLPATADSLTSPLTLTLVDRDGTRHLFTPRGTNAGISVTAAGAGAVLKTLLTPKNLLMANGVAAATVCVDQTYNAPAGVHLGVWRYLGFSTSGATCAPTTSGAQILGYVAERPDGLRTEYDATGRVVSLTDRSGVELDDLYDPATSKTPNVLRDVYERTSCAPGGGAATSAQVASLGDVTCRAYRFAYSADPSTTCSATVGGGSAVCVTDPAGRVTQYQLDSNKNLVAVVNPDGSSLAYKYAGAAGCPSEPAPNGAAALLCSASDLDGDTTTFTYAADATSSSLPPVVSQITDRRGYPTNFTYTTTTAGGATTITSTTVDAAPTTAGGCSNPSTVCERSLYSGIDGTGRVGMTQQGASSVNGSANPAGAGAPGTWLHSSTTVWDGAADPGTGKTLYCRLPDNTVDNDLCKTTTSAAPDPDRTTSFTYGVDGEQLSSTQYPGGSPLATTEGYHEQYWTTAASGGVTASTGDYTVDGNGGVASSAVVSPNTGNVLFSLSDHTQSLSPAGNQQGTPAAAASFLRTWQPDDATSVAPDTFAGPVGASAARECGTTGAPTGDTGLLCETDTPADTPTAGVATSTPRAGSCQSAPAGGGGTPKACTLYTYDGYGQRTTMTTPDQVAASGNAYTYTYATDHGGQAANPTTQTTDLTGSVNAGGWLIGVTDPQGNYTYDAYDPAGNAVETWDRDATAGGTATGPANFAPVGAASTLTHYTSTTYGSLTAPWRYPTSRSTPAGETTTLTVDPEGRLQRSVSPRGNPLRGQSGTTDATYATTYAYDAAGDPVGVTLPVGNDGLGGAALAQTTTVAGTTTVAYDAYGNKTAQTRPKSTPSDTVAPATEWRYDLVNRPTAQIQARTTDASKAPSTCPASNDPVFVQGSGATVYVCQTTTGYDAADAVTGTTAADGGSTSYSFDGSGRKTTSTVSRTTGPGGALTTGYVYDADNNVTDVCPPREYANGTGSCTSSAAYTQRAFSTHTAYDAADRPTTVTRFRSPDPNSPTARDPHAQAALTGIQTITTSTAYDLDGNALSSRDADGNTTSYTYDSLDRKTGMTAPHLASSNGSDTTLSYTTSWTYDPSGDTLSKTEPAGVDGAGRTQPRVTAYAYDADHRLTDTVTGASSTSSGSDGPASSDGGSNVRTRRYYDADGDLIAATDARAYASSVPAYGSEPATSYVTYTSYDADDRAVAAYTPHATASSAGLDGGVSDGQCPQAGPQTPNGAQEGTLPAAPPAFASGTYVCTSRLARDARGNVTTDQMPTSSGVTGAGLPSDNRYKTYLYSLDDHTVGLTSPDPSGNGSGRVTTTFALDGEGRKTGETDPGNGSGTNPTTTTAYNLDGTVASVTGQATRMTINGVTTTAATTVTDGYDADGHATSVTTGATGGGQTSTHTTRTYFDSDGLTEDTLDAGGDDTRYGYDSDGNATTVESPDEVASGSAWSTQNRYTLDDQLESTVTPVQDSASGAASVREVDYAYDPAGRRAQTHTYVGTENSLGASVTSTADGGTTYLAYLPDDLQTTQTGRNTGTTSPTITTLYDPAGNQTSVTDSSGGGSTLTMTYTPDDQLLTYKDGGTAAHGESYAYDADDQQTARAETGGTDARTVRYGYDDAEQLTAVYDPKLVAGGTASTTISYEPDGQPMSRSDASTAGTSSSPSDTKSYAYTAAGALASTSVNLGSGTTVSSDTYSYDELARQVGQTTTTTGQNGLAGNAAGAYAYSYDAAGRLNGFTNNGNQTAVTYDANGNRTAYGKQTFAYDDDNQLLSSKDTTGGTGYTERDDTYAYYPWGGQHADATTTVPTQTAGVPVLPTTTTTTCTTYDGFDRTALVGVGTPAVGPAAADPSSTCGGATDGAASKATSTYDGLDRLRSTVDSTASGSVTAGTTATEHYAGTGSELVTESLTVVGGTSPTNDLSYTTAPTISTPLAVVDTNSAGTTDLGPTAQYLLSDGKGNVTTALTQAAGTTSATLACAARYDPFGVPVNPGATASGDAAPNGTCSGTGTSPNTQWYGGARRDTATGTYQFGARTYNPGTAAFTTPDSYRADAPAADLSIGTDPLTNDSYTFVNGDPLNEADPSGHDPSPKAVRLRNLQSAAQKALNRYERTLPEGPYNELPVPGNSVQKAAFESYVQAVHNVQVEQGDASDTFIYTDANDRTTVLDFRTGYSMDLYRDRNDFNGFEGQALTTFRQEFDATQSYNEINSANGHTDGYVNVVDTRRIGSQSELKGNASPGPNDAVHFLADGTFRIAEIYSPQANSRSALERNIKDKLEQEQSPDDDYLISVDPKNGVDLDSLASFIDSLGKYNANLSIDLGRLMRPLPPELPSDEQQEEEKEAEERDESDADGF